MKTDVINVSSSGARMEKALGQVDKVAAYKGLSPKDALHLRLLTEEMMGMMRSITGEQAGQFWIEDHDGVYQLHLQVNTLMTMDKRDRLLAAATSGKNEAARGLMGRLRNFFEQGDESSFYMYAPENFEFSTTPTLDWEWSMSTYQNQLAEWAANDEKARAMWDELESSVVTHVADDIKVYIRGDRAEMVIYKKLQ